MTKKNFSIASLRIGDGRFELNDFDNISPEDNLDYKCNGEIYSNEKIVKSVVDDRFILLYFSKGDKFPRPEVVYNTTTRDDEENPLEENQIERDMQTFVLIDIKTQKVYLSDYRKKKTIEEWLQEKIRKTTLMKNVIDKENFLNEIQEVNTIYLSAVPNLFSEMGILHHELTNDQYNYGTGIKHIALKITFQPNSVPERLKNMINGMFTQKENDAIQKLEISGRYDDKFERVFNAEGIIDKITIETAQHDNGLFDEKQVFYDLIKEIL